MGNRRTLTSIDLFAGAGGLTEGLKEAGFTSLYANEVIEQYAKTFEHNHPGVVVDAQDVREVDAANVRRRLGLERGGVGPLGRRPAMPRILHQRPCPQRRGFP